MKWPHPQKYVAPDRDRRTLQSPGSDAPPTAHTGRVAGQSIVKNEKYFIIYTELLLLHHV